MGGSVHSLRGSVYNFIFTRLGGGSVYSNRGSMDSKRGSVGCKGGVGFSAPSLKSLEKQELLTPFR